jgi:hypothetical protein
MLRGLPLALVASATLAAQGPPVQNGPTGQAGLVETDPIRCWWRSSVGAVQIGEHFTVTLTCAVLDSDSVQVVPDETRLAAAVVQMAPFEVIGGSHPSDLQTGGRRFFQYHYTLRIISPDAIGQDISLPNLEIAYRVTSRLQSSASQQGRELSYLLPPHAVRVLSVVPEEAVDIRDTASIDFGRIESLTLRAGTLRIVGWTLVALAGLTVILALAGLARSTGRQLVVGRRGLSSRAIAGVAARELGAVERDAGAQGWSEPLIERALAAARLAGAQAIGAPIHQVTVANGAEPGGGRLLAPRRFGVGNATVLSASTTSRDIAKALDQNAAMNGNRRQELEDLGSALGTFSATLYGSGSDLDRSALDRAAGQALALARSVRSSMSTPQYFVRQWFSRSAAPEHKA